MTRWKSTGPIECKTEGGPVVVECEQYGVWAITKWGCSRAHYSITYVPLGLRVPGPTIYGLSRAEAVAAGMNAIYSQPQDYEWFRENGNANGNAVSSLYLSLVYG